MHRALFLVASMAAFAGVAPCVAQVESPPAGPKVSGEGEEQPDSRKGVYDESADGEKEIAEALTRAKKENRRVLIQWGANWCGWCIKLHETMHSDRELARKLLYEYDVVHIDIGSWDKHLELAERYGADFKSHGVPYLTILDADGNTLLNHETGSLEAEGYQFGETGKRSHDVEKLMALLTKHQAPYLAAESLLSDALASAKAENKAVLLHFGAPWCGWCHKFEAWLARPEVSEALAKDFIDLKIDTDRTLGGKDMLRHFAERDNTGIPWFLFLDADGKPIATSDAKFGNIGCPATDEEIAYFRDMLRKAATHLTSEDILEITSPLQEREKPMPAGVQPSHP